jgi:hypothetical protein
MNIRKARDALEQDDQLSKQLTVPLQCLSSWASAMAESSVKPNSSPCSITTYRIHLANKTLIKRKVAAKIRNGPFVRAKAVLHDRRGPKTLWIQDFS